MAPKQFPFMSVYVGSSEYTAPDIAVDLKRIMKYMDKTVPVITSCAFHLFNRVYALKWIYGHINYVPKVQQTL